MSDCACVQAVDHPYLVVHSASAPGAAEAQKKLQEEEAQGLLQGMVHVFQHCGAHACMSRLDVILAYDARRNVYKDTESKLALNACLVASFTAKSLACAFVGCVQSARASISFVS